MAPLCLDITDVVGGRESINLMVRVVRLWTVPSFTDASVAGSIEMILMDKQCETIHCTVRKPLVSKFQNMLVEGRCYTVCSLAVVPNLGGYRTTRHAYKVVFHYKTSVSPTELPQIPMYCVAATPFSEIVNERFDSDYLIDVMGLLTGMSQPKDYEREGKTCKMTVIELTSENVRLDCALFGDYVDQMRSYVCSGDMELPVVVLQSVKIKSFRGKIGLQNVMFATRILFNPAIEQVIHFKNSISTEGLPPMQNMNILSKPAAVTLEDEFMKLTPRCTVESLIANRESGSFIVMGTIKSIVEEGAWWYAACRCGRSVVPDSGIYFCDFCDSHTFSVSPRFKLKLEVEDHTGTGIFVLFERECSLLFKKTCPEFFMEHMKNPESVRSNSYPMIFNELLERKMLFKIETRVVSPNRYHGTFRVKRVCEDNTILAMFSLDGADLTPSKAIFTPAFTPSLSSEGVNSDGLVGGTSLSLGEDITINLGNDTSISAVPGFPVKKVQAFYVEKNVSAVFDAGTCNETSNATQSGGSIVTPAKRSLEQEFDDAAASPSKEKLKAVKVEMD